MNYEEAVGTQLWDEQTTVQDHFSLQSSSLLQAYITLLETRLKNDANLLKFEIWLIKVAQDFFQISTLETHRNENKPDDRPLYWSRIKFISLLKSLGRTSRFSSSLPHLINLFEEGSRNYTGINYSSVPKDCKKILITGFDPFLMNSKDYPGKHNHRQSNPSGCVALALHNTYTPNRTGYIQSMIFPVRYSDFDGSHDPESGMGEGVDRKSVV